MNPQPTLTAAQQAAAIDRAGQNLALRSGAGCGKTFVLARRFVELLLRGMTGVVSISDVPEPEGSSP